MKKNIIIFYNRIQEHLWFKPFLFCLFSVAVALFARQVDGTGLVEIVPDINQESIEGLLNTISASMLVISIFTVASMLSAFSAASNTATPRSFKIVVTDDVSQNALSAFIGAFIFSTVASIALDNGYYEKAGRFILFLSTLIFFALVILTFLRWVDRISRLGRLEHTIKQVETATTKALTENIRNPYFKALPHSSKFPEGKVIPSNSVGYVQHINLESLQSLATEKEIKIQLNLLPGKLINENFKIATISSNDEIDLDEVIKRINKAIIINDTRRFEEDPRFGLIALTEIASRALSPGINDPGTAIQIIGTHERLFFLWNGDLKKDRDESVVYDRVEVPRIEIDDFFDDAFRPIARDGADNIEVMLRLQKTLTAIETINHSDIKDAAIRHSKEAYERAELAIEFKKDLKMLKTNCLFNKNN